MTINDFLGTTTHAILSASYYSDQRGVNSVFFKPFTSPSQVLGRTMTVITDPLLLGTFSVYVGLCAGYELLTAFKDLVTLNTSSAKKNFSEASATFFISATLFITAVLSPIINLVDLIAGAITSLLPSKQNKEEPNFSRMDQSLS